MNNDHTLTHRRFAFAIMASRHEIAVQRFVASERMPECYHVQLWLVSEDEIVVGEVMEKEAVLMLIGQDQDRYFHGIINKFSLTGRNGRFYLYQTSLVPSCWFLSLNSNFRIFQGKSVLEIADEVLKATLPGQRLELRTIHRYEKRRYCTQFGESDWRFITRLFEEEGIFYFFQHLKDRHVLVVADDKVAYAPIAGEAGLTYHLTDGLSAENEVVTAFVYSRRISPGRVTHTNYNFKRPSLDLAVQQHTENHKEHEVYEYPGNYVQPERGKRLARVRLEEKKTLEESAEGNSNCLRLSPGYTFELSKHDFRTINKQYLIVTVTHKGTQSHVLGEQSGIGGDSSYSNEFLAIPADVTLRPERMLMKPTVGGLQSAMVVGPPGEEIYPDEYGRIKVQFHWDREGQRNERSSCWLRISQPWSGQSWGMISIPRVGDEVLVDFINGDPDWPIVVGSVNNAQSPALYPLPDNKTRSGIRTRSYPNGSRDNFHELRFEDKKGSEEIYLQSEKDWNILVKNNKAQNVGHDEVLQVGNNRLKTVGMDQMEQVGRNHAEVIGANKTVAVGSNKNETVAMNSAESIGLAKELTVGGVYQVSVVGAMNETVLGAKAEEVGITKQVMVGSHMTERVAGNRSLTVGEELSATVKQSATVKAKTIILEADEEIILRSGSATISLKSNGQIVMQGTNCTQLASGEIVIKGAKTSLN